MNTQAALTEAVYYILLSLVTPRHGYGIMQETERMSQGRVKLAAGTLYGALNGLLDRGWIRAVPGAEDSRRKEYALTDKGKEALESELDRLRELVDNGESVLGGEE
ncbi:MAG: helix-turn-helix transcriptional regulator [Clostridia bacterium]|nr:helix-turn-helix transcriptional regulator [Clostridia bacterium]MBQ6358648.1 helix-turn-helix transcriptional regulator [Clostridia bacterium]MBQ6866600.1 helix-turn-helix transcriptional regulator [Clostridia bacterium]MBQ7755439.1 helix-turn-helix transcriptional regulator [Clostridia bacterium]MBQ9923336.1 helix-turn-helix transcriptional regulator [Clostridia bacterium]